MNRRIIAFALLGCFSACVPSANLLHDGTYNVGAQTLISDLKAFEEDGRLAITGTVQTIGRETDHIYGRLNVIVSAPSGALIERQPVCFHATKERVYIRRGAFPEYVDPSFKVYTEVPPKGSVITFDTELGVESCD